MSTVIGIIDDAKGKNLTVTRFCAPANEREDRRRVQLSIDNECVELTRNETRLLIYYLTDAFDTKLDTP